MAISTLRLLGPFTLHAGPAGVPVRLGRKGEALLAVVAARGAGGVNRSTLVALLWPDHGDDEARNALRQCLHRMRSLLRQAPDLLEAEGDRLVIRESACDVDLWRFERLAARNECNSLLEAARLCRGVLAQGVNAGGEWERWLQIERQRLAGIAQSVLARLSEAAGAPFEYDEAIGLAQRLLADDPVHEGCYRALMRLYERAGQRATALRVWEECRSKLRVELNVEPCTETRALYERLREPSGDGAAAGRLALPPWATLLRRGPTTGVQERTRGEASTDHQLRGWQLFTHFRSDTNLLARAAFEEAIAVEPENASALSLVGFTHFFDSVCGWTEDPEQSFRMAERVADRALAIGGDHPAPHTLHGKLLLWRMEYDAALAELQRTLRGSDTLASVHFHLADVSAFAGLYEESLRLIRRALQLEPNDHGIFLTIEAFALLGLGKLEGARAACASAIARNPTYPWPHSILAVVLIELGDSLGAREAASTARRLNRRLSLDFGRAVFPLRDAGLRARMVRAWESAGMPEHEGEWPPD